jgi:hypothetical protein
VTEWFGAAREVNARKATESAPRAGRMDLGRRGGLCFEADEVGTAPGYHGRTAVVAGRDLAGK